MTRRTKTINRKMRKPKSGQAILMRYDGGFVIGYRDRDGQPWIPLQASWTLYARDLLVQRGGAR